MPRTLRCLGRFNTLFNLDSLLEYETTFSYKGIFPRFILVNYSPTKAVRTCIYAKILFMIFVILMIAV